MECFAKIYQGIDLSKEAFCAIRIINFLLTKREGRTGEYWHEVVVVRLEKARLVSKIIWFYQLS